MLLIIIVCSWVLIWLPSFEHEVHDSCQFVRRGYDGFGATMPGSNTTIKGAQSALAASQALCSPPKSKVGSVLGLLSAALLDFAASYFVVGAKPEPGCEVLDC